WADVDIGSVDAEALPVAVYYDWSHETLSSHEVSFYQDPSIFLGDFLSCLQDGERDLALFRLKELAALPNNWDGQGAADLTDSIVARAAGVLKRIRLLPTDITPHPSGTVMLEWETSLGRAYIEIGQTIYNVYAKARSSMPFAKVDSVENLDDYLILHDLLEKVEAVTEFPSQPSGITYLTYDM